MQSDKYELGERLGSGEFGEVYAAKNRDTGRAVAIKISRTEKAGVARTAVQHEGKIHSALVGVRGVPQLKECGIAGESYYLVMPLLGRTWAEESRGAATPATRECYAVGESILRTLERVHRAHIVHRDVTPGNVMFGLGGEGVFLCDFGLACAYRVDQSHAPDERPVGIVGTPAFLSTNVLGGHRPSRRDDIEGLAYSIWYALTGGEMPWTRTDRSVNSLMRCADGQPALAGVLGIIQHARSLEYHHRPDYDLLAEEMRRAGLSCA